MPEFFVTLAAFLSLIATGISILVGYTTLKQRKNEPGQKRWAEWEKWRNDINEHLRLVDNKLEHDNRRLKRMDEESVDNQAFQRIMLKSMKGILDASSDESMRRISAEIDEFLIRR